MLPLSIPTTALVAHTFLIGLVAITRRVKEIRARRIPLSALAHASNTASVLQNPSAMDNFNNLLQVPVLFYVLCLTIAQAGLTDPAFSIGAWCYVALRVLHSLIQISANNVKSRFYVWTLGNLVLCFLWLMFAIDQFDPSQVRL